MNVGGPHHDEMRGILRWQGEESYRCEEGKHAGN
jgi:hypothetical protein